MYILVYPNHCFYFLFQPNNDYREKWFKFGYLSILTIWLNWIQDHEKQDLNMESTFEERQILLYGQAYILNILYNEPDQTLNY